MLFRSLPASFRQQAKLQAEIIALRHQLTVLQRTPYPNDSCSIGRIAGFGSGCLDSGWDGVPP